MPDFNDSVSNTQIAALRKRGEEKLMQSLAPQYGYDYIDLHGYTLNPEALTKISEADARSAHMVAFELNRKVISVATNAPNQPESNRVVNGLQNKGYTVALYLCSNASLEHAFARYAYDHKSATASKRGVLDINPEDILKTARILPLYKTWLRALILSVQLIVRGASQKLWNLFLRERSRLRRPTFTLNRKYKPCVYGTVLMVYSSMYF